MTMTNDWVARARDLGPTVAAEAARHDADGTFVDEAYALLRQHRFFSMAVPASLGGGGATYDELCNTVRELAHYDGSTALAFSMHSHLVAAAVCNARHGKPGEALLRKVAAGELVLLSTGASDWIDSNGAMVRVSGGYEVTARKIFGSGGPAADLMITSARYDDPNDGPQVLHFPLSMRAPGVSIRSDWDTLGMRGTGSHTIDLERVFVADDAIALRRAPGQWHPAWSTIITVAPPIYMAAYVGVAEAAASTAKAFARTRLDSPHLVDAVGELDNEQSAARTIWDAMVERVRNFEVVPDLARANAQLIGKTLVARSVLATVDKAMEVTGGAGFFRKLGLERMLRDVQGAPYHPLPEKRQVHFSGRFALGLDPITGAPL